MSAHELPLIYTTYNSDASTPKHGGLKIQLNRMLTAVSPAETSRVDVVSAMSFASKTEEVERDRRFPSPEQGPEMYSRSPSEQWLADTRGSSKLVLDASGRHADETNNSRRKLSLLSRNADEFRRKLISKTLDLRKSNDSARSKAGYLVRRQEIKENPMLRHCASLKSLVRLRIVARTARKCARLESRRSIKLGAGREQESPAGGPQKCSGRAANVRRSVRGSISCQNKFQGAMAGTRIWLEEPAVKLNPEYYNQYKAREVLSQIKYHFKYQKASTFDPGPTCFSEIEHSVTRCQEYLLASPYCYLPTFAKTLYLELRQVLIDSRTGYLEFTRHMASTLLLLDEDGCFIGPTEELEDSHYRSQSEDESYEEGVRKKMIQDIKSGWYTSQTASMKSEEKPGSLLCYEGQKYGWRDMLKPGTELDTLDWQRPRRRRHSKQNMIIKLGIDALDSAKAAQHFAPLSDSEKEEADAGSEVPPILGLELTECEALLKTRSNEILRDVVPLDYNELMKTDRGRTAKQQHYGQRMTRLRIKSRLERRDIETSLKRAVLDPQILEEDKSSDSENPLALIGLLTYSAEGLLSREHGFRDDERDLQLPEVYPEELWASLLRSPKEAAVCYNKIDEAFSLLLQKSVDSYSEFVESAGYVKEQDVTVRKEMHNRDAGEMLDVDSLVAKNAECTIASERIVAPFILDGCGERDAPHEVRRSYPINPAERSPERKRPYAHYRTSRTDLCSGERKLSLYSADNAKKLKAYMMIVRENYKLAPIGRPKRESLLQDNYFVSDRSGLDEAQQQTSREEEQSPSRSPGGIEIPKICINPVALDTPETGAEPKILDITEALNAVEHTEDNKDTGRPEALRTPKRDSVPKSSQDLASSVAKLLCTTEEKAVERKVSDARPMIEVLNCEVPKSPHVEPQKNSRAFQRKLSQNLLLNFASTLRADSMLRYDADLPSPTSRDSQRDDPSLFRRGTFKNFTTAAERLPMHRLETRRRKRRVIPAAASMPLPDPAKLLQSAIRKLQINTVLSERQQRVQVEKILGTYSSIKFDTRDESGSTMLHTAVKSGSLPIVEMLIKAGADINAQDNSGNCPLHYARSYGYNKISDVLLASGASEAVMTNSGKTVWEGADM